MREPRIALVTGASSGIGRAIAARLAADRYRVYGTSRNPAKATPLPGVTLVPLDVTTEASVEQCVATLLAAEGRLDLLVNNAGIAVVGAIEEVPLAQARQQFDTNYFGVVRMIQAVLPAMRRQRGGHIINVSSVAGLVPIPFAGQYSASKYALEGLTEVLRSEVALFGIRVALVEPGFYRSELVGAAATPERLVSAYDGPRSRVHERMRAIEAAAPPPTEVAEVVLRLARHPDPPLRTLVGKERIFALLKRFLPFRLFEPNGRRYWRLSA
ncbi:MAG: SDR family NAD(P)-dependent oxidoreductase [Gemmatimonadales bacterium]